MTQMQIAIFAKLTVRIKPRNTSPPDDAPQSPTWSAPAPARIRRSAARRRSPPASAAQTASSDPPGSGTPDIQTNTAIRDTSDEQIANFGGVFAGDSQLFAHLLVMQFRQRLRRFHAQPVQIQIFRVLSAFKQPLRFDAMPSSPIVTSESPITSIFPEAFGAKKSEMQSRRPSRCRGKVKRKQFSCDVRLPASRARCGRSACDRPALIHDHVISVALRREISVHDFRFKQARGRDFFFQLAS